MTYNMNNYLMIKAHSHQEESKSTPQLSNIETEEDN